MFSHCTTLTLSDKTKMVLRDESLVAYEIHGQEREKVFSELPEKIKLVSCKDLDIEKLQWIFQSLREENPTLFGRKDRPIFPTGREGRLFAEKILQTINQPSNEGNLYFFIWKEEDSLNPYTRILRTSFYAFCSWDGREGWRFHMVFGEWKKDIAFQNQYTFSDWIVSPRFVIQPSGKDRFFLLESSRNQLGFQNFLVNGERILYPDWIVYFPSSIPQGWMHSQSPTSSFPSVEERLRTLEDLRKKNLITEEEYKTTRKRILDSL